VDRAAHAAASTDRQPRDMNAHSPQLNFGFSALQ
jgi:hypothetical protein